MKLIACLFWSFILVIIYGLIIEILKNRVNGKHEKLVKLLYKKKCKRKIVRTLKTYDRVTKIIYHYAVFPSKLKKDSDIENDLIIFLTKKFRIPFVIWLYISLTAVFFIFTNYNIVDIPQYGIEIKKVIDNIIEFVGTNKRYFSIVVILVLFLLFRHYKNKFYDVVKEEMHEELKSLLKLNIKIEKIIEKILYDASNNIDILLNNNKILEANFCSIEAMRTIIPQLDYNNKIFTINPYCPSTTENKLVEIESLNDLKKISEDVLKNESYHSSTIWFIYKKNIIDLGRLYLNHDKLLKYFIDDFITSNNYNSINNKMMKKELENIKNMIDSIGKIDDITQTKLNKIYNELKLNNDYRIVKIIDHLYYMNQFCDAMNKVLSIKSKNLVESIKNVKQ